MKVTKTVDVNRCSKCPYYYKSQDMNATLHGCELIDIVAKSLHLTYNSIFDNDSWEDGIYDKCPYKEKPLYRKEILIKDWDYDDWTSGQIILDWTPEEEWDGQIPKYRFTYKIFERFFRV